jgi:hypothetical protein
VPEKVSILIVSRALKILPLKPIVKLFHSMVSFMSGPSQSKASMKTRLPKGDFLTLIVWHRLVGVPPQSHSFIPLEDNIVYYDILLSMC